MDQFQGYISFVGDTLHADIYSGSSLLTTVSSQGHAFPPMVRFPEGSISFSGQPFDKIIFHSDVGYVAIDNLTVTSTGVGPGRIPEPATFPLLLLTGVIGMTGYLRRKRT